MLPYTNDNNYKLPREAILNRLEGHIYCRYPSINTRRKMALIELYEACFEGLSGGGEFTLEMCSTHIHTTVKNIKLGAELSRILNRAWMENY